MLPRAGGAGGGREPVGHEEAGDSATQRRTTRSILPALLYRAHSELQPGLRIRVGIDWIRPTRKPPFPIMVLIIII